MRKTGYSYETEEIMEAHRKRRAEMVKEFMLAEIKGDPDATAQQHLSRAVIDADAFLKWEEEQ